MQTVPLDAAPELHRAAVFLLTRALLAQPAEVSALLLASYVIPETSPLVADKHIVINLEDNNDCTLSPLGLINGILSMQAGDRWGTHRIFIKVDDSNLITEFGICVVDS